MPVSLILTVIRVSALVGLIAATSCATKEAVRPEPQTISWKQAVALIRGGGIEGVMQTHSLHVWMKGTDGREHRTREPKIDAVWHLIDEVDPGHGRIRFATE